MIYNPDIHKRRSIRLKGYDYKNPGAYFVTICTQNKEHLFGSIEDGEIISNEPGLMVERIWQELPVKYPAIEIDECGERVTGVVQQYEIAVGAIPRGCPDSHGRPIPPNTVGAIPRGCPDSHGRPIPPNTVGAIPRGCPDEMNGQALGHGGQALGHGGQALGPAPTQLSLPDVVHRFKSFTTAQYRNGVQQFNWRPFPGRLWQRNYYEHIIRDEKELNSIREYIIHNPLNWLTDADYS